MPSTASKRGYADFRKAYNIIKRNELCEPWNAEAVHQLRLCREITASRRLLVGRDGVIPFTVEFIVRDVDRVHLVVGHLDAFRVQVGVDLAADLQAGVGRRGADELDDDLMADQWFATPVHGDEGEQAMLNPVPLAGAGRQVGHRYLQASLIGEALQFALP